jgi:putative ABC transport system permease protein
MRDWQAFVRARLPLPDLAPERESRIVRELAAQLEDFYRDARAAGRSDADADAHARRQIADWRRLGEDVLRADRAHTRPRIDRLAERIEDAPRGVVRGGTLMFAEALRDGRFAVRQLIKTPGFTLVAVITLALGIGATSAIFSVVNGVLLRPLPYPDPDGLVRVHEVVPQYGRFSVAPASFLDWRTQNTVFEQIAAYAGSSVTLTDGGGPERVSGADVTWELFELLRVAPRIGAGLTEAHETPGANGVAVISHDLWQSRFGADPAVVGRTVTFNGAPVTILGVMSSDFYFPTRAAQYWRPIQMNTGNRGGHYIGVVARMKAGVTAERAGIEMQSIAERLAAEYPESSANETAEVVPLHDQVVGGVRPALLTLLAAVGVVVLIACANVANLLLVRASVREKEVAIRAALGAGRRRLVVQMLVESLVLAAAGGAMGLALAYAAMSPLQSLSAGSIPRVTEIAIDGTVLGFTAFAVLLTGLLFGLAPAWQASRAGLGSVLKEGGRSSTSTGGRWMRSSLLVAEVALSIVLLVGAALLLRSFEKLTRVDPGFSPDPVLAFQVSLPATTYPDAANRVAFFDTLLSRLEALPGVRAAGMIQTLPMRGSYVLSFDVDGRPPAPPGEGTSAYHRVISPHYFQSLGIPLRRGRIFDERDTETSPMVALVDEAFVKRHFPEEEPIGRRLDIGNGTDGFYEVVGVVGDVHYSGLDAVPSPTMYVPWKQDIFSTMWVLATSDADPSGLATPVRDVVRDIDRGLPTYSTTPLRTIVDDSVAERRFSMLLLAGFAAVALFLAAVGLYGVVSYSVSQRTREIGLRMAVGAQPGDVVRLVLGGGMKLAVIGVAIGLGGAIALSSLVESMLFGVTPSDATSYAATAGLLLAIAAVACFVPARRAMRVDPIIALHQE